MHLAKLLISFLVEKEIATKFFRTLSSHGKRPDPASRAALHRTRVRSAVMTPTRKERQDRETQNLYQQMSKWALIASEHVTVETPFSKPLKWGHFNKLACPKYHVYEYVTIQYCSKYKHCVEESISIGTHFIISFLFFNCSSLYLHCSYTGRWWREVTPPHHTGHTINVNAPAPVQRKCHQLREGCLLPTDSSQPTIPSILTGLLRHSATPTSNWHILMS